MTLDLTHDPLALLLANAAPSRKDRLVLGSLLGGGPVRALRLAAADPIAQAAGKRTRIWQLDPSLHCSIIGTCLATSEIRQIVVKLNIAGAQQLSDHDLHKYGVTLAGQRDGGSAKVLHKALDRRHQRVIAQFDKAKSEAEVRGCWDEAVRRGEIPGAFWALLTHPATGNELIKRAFGEVHMLSHLVGAANRADIRRLRELEDENSALKTKVERQQGQIRETVMARETRIRDLEALLARATAEVSDAARDAGRPGEPDAGSPLLASLERRLASAAGHRQRIEERLKIVEQRLIAERALRAKAERHAAGLQGELEIVESALASSGIAVPADDVERAGSLSGQTVLYVGGRIGQVSGLHEVAGRFQASLLHHDGGIEDSGAQLAGLISQAGVVFFPTDRVSHDAMHKVKRLSRQAGKPFVPLRSAGLTSFLAALRAVARLVADDATQTHCADPGF